MIYFLIRSDVNFKVNNLMYTDTQKDMTRTDTDIILPNRFTKMKCNTIYRNQFLLTTKGNKTTITSCQQDSR